jgi:hypothetical protein
MTSRLIYDDGDSPVIVLDLIRKQLVSGPYCPSASNLDPHPSDFAYVGKSVYVEMSLRLQRYIPK